MPNPPISDKQKAFCREYLIDSNGMQAAIRAEYSPGSAKVTASRMLTYANVQGPLTGLQATVAARSEVDVDTVLKMWWAIATVDINELISHRICACRYCPGIGQLYQWRTRRELAIAQAEFDMAHADARPSAAAMRPDERGGFGFRGNVATDPDCPECDGLGVGRVVLKDTTRLSLQAGLLFKGVHTTREWNVRILVADREKAVSQIARCLGMFQPERISPAEDGMAEFLRDLFAKGSKAPISTEQGHGQGAVY